MPIPALHGLTNRVFITNSRFEGAWCKERQCMEGFGCYTYADGSSYRGYFKNGQFNGYGIMKMAAPYSYTLAGLFENGNVVSIEKMHFKDGVSIPAKTDGNGKNFELTKWDYLSSDDRCFLFEILHGFQATTPFAIKTKRIYERTLSPHQYDVEEGIFDEKSGFVTERESPLKPLSYLGCAEQELDWIKSNCRKGFEKLEMTEPSERDGYKILQANFNCQKWINKNLNAAQYSTVGGQNNGYQYFSSLFEKEIEEAEKTLKGKKSIFDGKEPVFEEPPESCSSFVVDYCTKDVESAAEEASMGSCSSFIDEESKNVEAIAGEASMSGCSSFTDDEIKDVEAIDCVCETLETIFKS